MKVNCINLGTRRQKKTGQITNDHLEEECREKAKGEGMAVISGGARASTRDRDGKRAFLNGLMYPAGHDERQEY